MSDQILYIYSLNCDELADYLKQNGFTSEVCQVIKGKENGYNYYIFEYLILNVFILLTAHCIGGAY